MRMHACLMAVFMVLALVIAGCGTAQTPEKIAPVCNKPYILVGTSCCLDSNDNRICDTDEAKAEGKPEAMPEPKAETPKAEMPNAEQKAQPSLLPDQYKLKEGDSVTIAGKKVIFLSMDPSPGLLRVTVSVDGVEGDIYKTDNGMVLNGLRVKPDYFYPLEHSALFELKEFKTGPGEYFFQGIGASHTFDGKTVQLTGIGSATVDNAQSSLVTINIIYNGTQKDFLIADTVVLAVGLKPNNGLWETLSGEVREIYAIGDCVKPRRVLNAIWEGFRTARLI